MTRGRRPAIIPAVKLTLVLPIDLRAQLDLHLFSDLEGRVPKGRYKEFFEERIREFFGREALDLAPWIVGGTPGTTSVTGSPVAIDALKRMLSA